MLARENRRGNTKTEWEGILRSRGITVLGEKWGFMSVNLRDKVVL